MYMNLAICTRFYAFSTSSTLRSEIDCKLHFMTIFAMSDSLIRNFLTDVSNFYLMHILQYVNYYENAYNVKTFCVTLIFTSEKICFFNILS